MNLYVESSALLAELLEEPSGASIREKIGSSRFVVSSRLTFFECRRVLERFAATDRIDAAGAADSLARVQSLEEAWEVAEITETIWNRASRRFPREPVRSLDALHLATMLEWSHAVGNLAVLSLDERILANARALDLSIA